MCLFLVFVLLLFVFRCCVCCKCVRFLFVVGCFFEFNVVVVWFVLFRVSVCVLFVFVVVVVCLL